ncbi:MAG: LA2681 family HEPN domain-containing protein [Anaerolineae bacterium]
MASAGDLVTRAETMIYAGDARAALALARRLEARGHDGGPALGRIYVEVGFAQADEALIRHGMDLAEGYLRRSQDGEQSALAHSVLGDGYLALYGLKYPSLPVSAVFLGGELDQAKNHYRQALAAGTGDDSFRAGVLASLGDCFDHAGRAIEALERYEEALAYQPDHAMALANKALGFLSYSRLAGEHRGTFLIEAYWLLSRALEDGVGAESEPLLRDYVGQIRGFFAETQLLDSPPAYAGCRVEALQPLESFATEFCLRHRLYLSICTFCQRCNAAIGDSAIIRGLAPAGEPAAVEDGHLLLCEHLNQIKQDFVAARFSLILAEAEQVDLSFVDAGVALVDTLGINLHGVRTELLKGSFRAFYGVIDKIASFLNEYMSLGVEDTRADFRRIWYSDWKAKAVHPALLQRENLSLSALFDIHRDFETGPYESLRLLRNVLTHGFVNVVDPSAGRDGTGLTRDDLLAKTLSLAAVVRNAVIYLISLVDDEENRGAAVPEGAVPRSVAQEPRPGS